MPKKLLQPEQARDWLVRRYNNHHRAWLENGGEWPLSVGLGTPTERDLAEDAAGVRAWVESWAKWAGLGEVQWEERKWPRLGTQKLPVSLVLDCASDVAASVGHKKRWSLATERYEFLVGLWPRVNVRADLARHFDVLADYSAEDFGRLVNMVTWLAANPNSGYYLRQLPVIGLDTKWLEKRTGLVVDLLMLMRTVEKGVDADGFHAICGLIKPGHRIRIRILCPMLRNRVGGLRDIEAPVDELAELLIDPTVVLIVENQETGVALPDMDGVVAVMKLGNAVSALGLLPWLHNRPSIYWGDLDTHGLAILSRARHHLPLLRSVLMDEATLFKHKALWGQEPSQHSEAGLPNLTADERAVFDGLKSNVWGHKVRLEQERLPWGKALSAVNSALKFNRAPPPMTLHESNSLPMSLLQNVSTPHTG